MKCKIRFLILSLYFSVLAENFRWSPVVDSVLNLIMKQDYVSALQVCNSNIESDPSNIDAVYLKLAVLQAQVADYETYAIDGLNCISAAESTLSLVEKKLATTSSDDEKTKLMFYKGNIYGVLSIVKAKRGNFLPGIKVARASYDAFKRIEKHSSEIPDILYGLGLFDYYLGDNLKWIPGLGKRAIKGLEFLFISSGSDSPFRYAAKNSLLWILIERGEFKAADSIASEVLESFPGNTLFLQIKSRAVFGAAEYEKAIMLGEKLIDLSFKRNPVNWSDVLSGYQLITASYLKLGDKKKAEDTAVKGLSFKISSDTLKVEWVQKHRDYLASIIKKDN